MEGFDRKMPIFSGGWGHVNVARGGQLYFKNQDFSSSTLFLLKNLRPTHSTSHAARANKGGSAFAARHHAITPSQQSSWVGTTSPQDTRAPGRRS
jgi:hypothetical protein